MYAGKGLLELNLNYFTAFPYSSNKTFKNCCFIINGLYIGGNKHVDDVEH